MEKPEIGILYVFTKFVLLGIHLAMSYMYTCPSYTLLSTLLKKSKTPMGHLVVAIFYPFLCNFIQVLQYSLNAKGKTEFTSSSTSKIPI
jgi:hypothetical protein